MLDDRQDVFIDMQKNDEKKSECGLRADDNSSMDDCYKATLLTETTTERTDSVQDDPQWVSNEQR